MDGIRQQRRTKHRPELSIPPVSLQEIGTPILEQLTTTQEHILIRFPVRKISGSPRFKRAASHSISTGYPSCALGLPLSPTHPRGAG